VVVNGCADDKGGWRKFGAMPSAAINEWEGKAPRRRLRNSRVDSREVKMTDRAPMIRRGPGGVLCTLSGLVRGGVWLWRKAGEQDLDFAYIVWRGVGYRGADLGGASK